MPTTLKSQPAHSELRDLLRAVRNRWRLGLALRGLAVVAAVALGTLLLAALGLERFGFGDGAVVATRVVVYLAIAAAAVWWLLVPLLRRPPDEQVALYLEEHEPSLDAAVVSAVERGAHLHEPAPFDARLVESAMARARAVDSGRRVERPRLRTGGVGLAAVGLAAVALLVLGPDALRRAARALFLPASTAAAAEPGMRRISVEPGDLTLARGGDQLVRAALLGFGAESALLVVRRAADSVAGVQAEPWEHYPMAAADSGAGYTFRLFDIVAATEYYVEAAGVRSPTYRLSVADLPFVERLDLFYDYPAYTGLAADSTVDGGDIVAPRGTAVQVRARTTMPVRGGRLIVEGRDTVLMAPDAEGTLSGTLAVAREGFYKIELETVDGRYVPGSLDYVIDVIDDAAPTVRIAKPGRDAQPTSLEEVFAEVRAEDDYGVAKVELVYSVNGGAEQTVSLHGGRALREVTAGHTFFLEEFGLQAGDLVSYYARATDGDRASGPKTATTDIYFMQIRPFGRDYRAAEQQGGGGGGGGGATPSSLSRQQRDVVAATFKSLRDRQQIGEARFRQDVSTIVLAQDRVREAAEELVQQLRTRGVMQQDSAFQIIAEELPKAVAAMREAGEALARRDADGALPAEQRALQHLQRAEAAYREVQISQGGGGGGGGGGGSSPEELADLFELETDKLQNQYETVERAQQQQAQQEVDEVLERMRELARRQQQENERMQQAAQRLQSQGGGSGGGQAQRQMAQEAEELARRLERLAREQSSPSLQDAARGLQDAANQLRRAGSDPRTGAAAGAAASQQLEEARRRLMQDREEGLQESVRNAAQRAQEIARQQQEQANQLGRLGNAQTAERARAAQQLGQRRNELAEQVNQLEQQLATAARAARAEQPEAARRMQEAASAIRERRLEDKLEVSAGEIARRGASDYARSLEEMIGEDVNAIRQAVEQAAGSMRASGEQGREERALERARDLVRSLESLSERTREAAEGEQGQGQGQGGEQQGERGEQGQRGEGQQGQGQQGQGGQGQQGQQGQGGQGGQNAQGGRGLQPGAMSGVQPGGSGRGGGMPGGRNAISGEDARQLGREFAERRREAEGLRRELQQQGLNTTDMDRLLQQLRELEAQRSFDDPEELQRLQSSVLEGFKAFEFALRRALLGSEANQPLLGRAAEAPERYRALVEEYYRSLARTPPR